MCELRLTWKAEPLPGCGVNRDAAAGTGDLSGGII